MLDLTAKIDTEQVNRSLDQMRKRAKSAVSGMVNDFELLDSAILTLQKRMAALGQVPAFSILSQGLKRAQQEFRKLDFGFESPEISSSATASVREFSEALLRMDKVLAEIPTRNNAFDALSRSIMETGQQLDRFLTKMGEMQQKTGVSATPSVGVTTPAAGTAQNTSQTAAVKSETVAYRELLSELEKVSAAKRENAALMETLRVQNARYKAAITDLNKAQQSGRMLTDEEIAKRDRLSLAYEENKVAISKLRSELANQIKLEQAAQGSMDEMSQALSRMRVVYRSLNADERNTTFGQNLLKNIEVLDAKIKQLDASTGVHARNVGNYASSYNGLSFSIQQVARELPSLSVGLPTFFLAISNNLPILSDELTRARKEYQGLVQAGQKATPVWKQIISSIFSWQTALVAGITVLTVYGKEISHWVGSLFKGRQALDTAKIALDQFHATMLAGSKNAQQEKTELDLLYKAAMDVSRSMTERANAVSKLQAIYPEYFGNLTQEQIMIGKARDRYDELTDAIIRTARAEAARDKIAENSRKILDVQSSKEYKEYALQAKFAEGSSIESLLPRSQGNEEAASRLKWELEQAAEAQGRTLFEAYKKANGEVADEIEQMSVTSFREYIETLEKINEELAPEATKLYTDPLEKGGSTTATNEQQRLYSELQSSLRKLCEEALQAEIDMMEEGTAKKLAQIDLDYRKQLETIEENERKIAEAQGGRLTDEQQAQFGTLRNRADTTRSKARGAVLLSGISSPSELSEQFDAEQKAWEEYYIAYGTFREKLQATKEKYDREIAEAGNDAERRSIEAARDEALAALELEGSEWAKTILTWSTEQLSEKIRQTTEMLEEALDAYNAMASSTTSEAEQSRKVIAKLKAQIDLLEKARKKVDSGKSNADATNWADIAQALEAVGSGAREAASSVKDFDEDLADVLTTTANIVTGLGQMANVINGVKSATSALEKSSAIFAVISAGIQIISGIFGAAAENRQEAEEFRREVSELNRELEQLKINARMETQGTIFGDDLWATAIENIKTAREELERYNEALDNSRHQFFESSTGFTWLDEIKDFDTAAAAIANMQVKTGTKGWWFWKHDTYDSLKNVVPGLFGDDGQLDMDALTEFVDSKTFSRLSDQNQEYIRDIVDAWGNYQEALENVNDYLTDVFGQLGSNISDALADAFANSTDAAREFTDSVSEMIEKMAKDMAYASILQPIFDEAQQKFQHIFGDASLTDEERFNQASGAISDLIDGITDGQHLYNDLLGQLQEIAAEKGIDIFQPEAESSQSGTSRGFSTMSQDTASELNGRFTDIQGKINILVEQAQFGRSISIEQLNRMTDTRDILVQMNGNVADIRTFTKVLPEMSAKLDRIARNTDNL